MGKLWHKKKILTIESTEKQKWDTRTADEYSTIRPETPTLYDLS